MQHQTALHAALRCPAQIGLPRTGANPVCQTAVADGMPSGSDLNYDRIIALSMGVSLSAHEIFICDGDASDHCFLVSDGTTKSFKLLPDGRQQIVAFAFTGDFIGLAVRGTFPYSIEAVTHTRIRRFDRLQFDYLRRAYPALDQHLRHLAFDELANAQDQLLLLGRKSATERVASFLLQLSVRSARRGGMSQEFTLSMTRADMADYLGMRIETVSRALSQLKRARYGVLRPGHHVTINSEALRRISGDNSQY